jgi:protein translocase SecG subunit
LWYNGNMVHMLSIVQITLAILLIALVLIQRANTDASGAFGADGTGASYEKRGAEKTLHRMTIIVSVAFVLTLAFPLIAR